MDSHSAFQTLPTVILHRIVDYATYELLWCTPNIGKKGCTIYWPVFQTFGRLRHVVFSKMFQMYDIYIITHGKFSADLTFSINVHKNDQLYKHYVRKLNIEIDFKYAADGSALDWLAMNNKLQLLPSVTILEISFENIAYLENDTRSLFNLEKLIANIRHIIPSVRQVTLTLCNNSNDDTTDTSSYITTIINELSKNVENFWLVISMNIPPAESALTPWQTKLTLFSGRWDENYQYLAQILYANCDSLVELTIKYNSYKDVSRLVVDDTGTVIKYTHLTRLVISSNSQAAFKYGDPVETGAPFTVLKKLDLYTDYPFSDDVLFRDNNKSLEMISMNVMDPSISMLCNKGVFAKGRLSRLKRLWLPGELGHSINTLNNNYLHIINSAPYLEHLYVYDSDVSKSLIPTVSTNQIFNMLISVAFTNKHLSLTEMLGVIHGLPLIKNLACQIGGIDEELQHKGIMNIKSMVHQRYSQPCNSFKSWTIQNNELASAKHSVACILFVAGTCPNLTFVSFIALHNDDVEQLNSLLPLSKLYKSYNFSITKTCPRLTNSPGWSIKHV